MQVYCQLIPSFILTFAGYDKPDYQAFHDSNTIVNDEIRSYMTDIVGQNITHKLSERFILHENFQTNLDMMQENLNELKNLIDEPPESDELSRLNSKLAEGLHAALSSVADSIAEGGSDDYPLLEEITSDKGRLMESIRKTYIGGVQQLSEDEKARLMLITGLFQRIVWLSRNLVKNSPINPVHKELQD